MYATNLLSSQGEYLRTGVVQISVANLTVIVLMIVVFVLALVLPFPNGDRKSEVNDVRR